MKKKKKDGLDGVTVGGIPVKQYLDDQEQEEQKESFMEHVNGEVVIHRRNMPPQPLRTRHEDKTITARGKPRVADRVRHLSQEEIEKEYGPMAKKISKPELLITALKNKGSLTSVRAAEITGYTRRTAGTTLWRLMKVWPDGMEVDRTESPIVYTMLPKLRRKILEQLVEEYRAYCREEYYKRQAKKRSDVTYEDDPNTVAEVEPPMATRDTVIEAPIKTEDHNVNININVTVRFKWGGE